MRFLIISVLSLLMLQVLMVQTQKKTNYFGAELSIYPAFADHCDEIFNTNNLIAHVIKGVLDELEPRLKTVCGSQSVMKQLANIVGSSLWCNGNLPATTELLLTRFVGVGTEQCPPLRSYHGFFIPTH